MPIRLLRENGAVVGAELKAPQPLSVGAAVPADDAAACLSLDFTDISGETHSPLVLSVGLAFLVAEVSSREALRRAKPDLLAHAVPIMRGVLLT